MIRYLKGGLLSLLLLSSSSYGAQGESSNSFIKFIQNGKQKPHSYYVNKGVIKLVNSDEEFWVKYGSKDIKNLECTIKDGVLTIDSNRDDTHIEINLADIKDCRVSVGAGIVEVHHICKSSEVSLSSGNMKVHVDKKDAGKIHAKVDTGILKNHSNLRQMQAEQKVGYDGPGINTGEILLVGDQESFSARFTVGSGIMEIGE